MNPKKKQKRIFLVNRDFQFRYAGAAILVGIASTILTITLILLPLYQFEILRIPRFLPIPVLALMGLAGVLNIGLIGFMGVFLTHKIAGPMYSLVRSFRGIEESGVWAGEIKLRDGDDLKYIVRNFNAMMASIQNHLHDDISKLEGIRGRLAESDSADIDAVITELQGLESTIKSRISPDKSPPMAS